MVYIYDDGWSYTQTLDYSINGNNLELTEETDICDEWFGTNEECFTYLEIVLNIDPGSLEEIAEHYEMTFIKAATKQRSINNNAKSIRKRYPHRKYDRGIFDKLKLMN